MVFKVLLLFWKSVLLTFGDFHAVENSKAALRQESDVHNDEHDQSFITASPLDYHLFRQEITSKYPAYSPPAPLVPIEDQNNSILPPLDTHPSRQSSLENLRALNADMSGTGNSIFNQPVHIATPAPSPPPSPAGPGGKGGKKQNYQTNQNFPFLYPPLDDPSNGLWSKGDTVRQDQLAGTRWDGRDVPASILEAGQLFASRMRMSRSIRQLWDVRENYIKYERGWHDLSKTGAGLPHEILQTDPDDDIEDSQDSDESKDCKIHSKRPEAEPQLENEEAVDDEVVQSRINAINEFYVCVCYKSVNSDH